MPLLPLLSNAQEATSETDKQIVSPAEKAEIGAQLGKLISAGKLEEAIKLFDETIASKSGTGDLQPARGAFAARYADQGMYDKAAEQMLKLYGYHLAHTETVDDAAQLAGAALQMGVYASRSGNADYVEAATEAIDEALTRCKKLIRDDSAESVELVTKLVSTKAIAMSQAGKAGQARELLQTEAGKLAALVDAEDSDEFTTYAHLQVLTMLGTRSPLGVADEDYAERLDAALADSLERFPESSRLRLQYAISQGERISSMSRDDPEAAVERCKNVLVKLEKFAEDDPSLQGMVERIKVIEKSIQNYIVAARSQVEIIGKPAPPLQADAWVNAAEGAEDSLKGKVVMYDFWAVWCGPCIATFPHLREWRSEFGDQGFEIVGITRYYGYEWDEDADRAVRAKEEVSPEIEQEAITKFLQSKDMEHPSIVTAKDSTLQQEYGVTGIPHAVLVDREGNVQMIKVGSGEANAKALHDKIKELLAE